MSGYGTQALITQHAIKAETLSQPLALPPCLGKEYDGKPFNVEKSFVIPMNPCTSPLIHC